MISQRFPLPSPHNARHLSYRSCRLPLWICCGLVLLTGCQQSVVPPAVPHAQTRYEQGVKSLQKGDIDGAKASFETAIRLDTSYAPAYLALANIAVHDGDFPRAIGQLETLQRAAPKTPHLDCRLAELHGGTGRFLEGMAAAKLAIDREPDCPRAKMQYGLMLVGTGDLKEATTYLESAHQLQPENPRITLELARLLARNGRSEDAWKLLDILPSPSALPVQEDTLRGRLMADGARKGKRDNKQALAYLKQALALAPEDGSANLEKGRILQRLGDPQGALKYLQTAARVSPPSVELLSTMAQVGKQLKTQWAAQMEQSARKFAALVDDLYMARRRYLAAPDNRENQMRLARLEAAIGNGRDAEELLTQVLKKNPNDSEALKLLSMPDTKPRESANPLPSH